MNNTLLNRMIDRSIEDNQGNSTHEEAPKLGRRRSPTLLKLQWLAERVRKCEKIKAQLAAGTYQCDSTAVAKAMLWLDDEEISMK